MLVSDFKIVTITKIVSTCNDKFYQFTSVYRTKNITLYYIIIQLTPRWGFSVTDYIKYYAYSCYWLYIPLQQSRYYFPKYTVYPNPPCQLVMWEETGAPGVNSRLSAERWQTFFARVHSENRTHDLRGKRRFLV